MLCFYLTNPLFTQRTVPLNANVKQLIFEHQDVIYFEYTTANIKFDEANLTELNKCFQVNEEPTPVTRSVNSAYWSAEVGFEEFSRIYPDRETWFKF